MSKDLEQEQEHVSENPEVKEQDTERAASSELPPEEKTETTVNEEITPHENAVEKTDGKIDTIEEKPEENIDVTEVYIDMSKIKFDKDGIPEFTEEDKQRLKATEIVFQNFENEIEDAREYIFQARKELDEETQKEREKLANEGIKENETRLAEISKLSESELTDEIKEEKEKLEVQIQYFKEVIVNLPKNNPKIKLELENRIQNSIKHIATYQNVSRYNLGDLQKDGTIAALISSTANTAFGLAFVDSIRLSKNESSIDDNEEIKSYQKELDKLRNDYEMKNAIKSAYDDFVTVKFPFILNHTKELDEGKFDEETAKVIEYNKIKEIPDLVEAINPFAAGEKSESIEKYEDIRTSLVGVDENELDKIKEARRIENEYIDEITKFKNAAFVLNFLVAKTHNIKEIDTNVRHHISGKATVSFDQFKDSVKDIVEKEWTEISEKYNSIDDKIESTKDELIKPLKNYMKEAGLFSSFASYAFANSEKRGYYGRPESLLEFDHVKLFGEKYYNCIRNVMKNDSEEEYNRIKTNVNSVSMTYNNIIKYFSDLYFGTVEIEWASNFDPDSVLKNFYFDHKEALDEYIKEYLSTVKVLSHVICHNVKFKNKYTKFVSDVVEFINANQAKIKKINDGKKVKDKYKFMTDIAFAYQFTSSYTRFVDLIKEVDEAVTKKRDEEKDIKFEEFDKWYKENLLAKELKATEPVVSSLLHLILGCNIIYAFDEFNDYFESKNKNKYLRSDCYNYIFNEYILESFAFRNCPKDKTYSEYIKTRSKTVAFQSLDYTFQKDVNIEKSRLELITYIFGYAANCIKDIVTITCGDPSKENEEKPEVEEKTDTKKKKKSHEELVKEYRAKAKEKKKQLGNFRNSIKDYKTLINNLKADNTLIQTSDANNIYDISVFSSKDTKVIVRIDRYTKDINEKDVKQIFESAIIDPKNTQISIDKAYVASKRISNDNLTNINEKWYYNQYIDGSLVKRADGTELSTIKPEDYTISERYRNTINVCLKNAQDKIIESAINIIKKTGVNFEGKTIAVKNNCKFDIKYFKANHSNPEFFDGNLNFFKAGLWDIITIELNYDIVNKK